MSVVVFTGGSGNANLIMHLKGLAYVNSSFFNRFLHELFITLLFFNQNSKQFYDEWRFEKAKKYAYENAQRFDLILKSKSQQVAIPPSKIKTSYFSWKNYPLILSIFGVNA